MKKLNLGKENDKYDFFVIDSGEIENVNIGAILAVPKGELKTRKMLTIFSEDKYKTKITDKETGEERQVLTQEDAAMKMHEYHDLTQFTERLGLDGQIVLMPMLPNDERISETLDNSEKKFSSVLLSRECFTDIPENNPYYRIDEQIAEMMKHVISKYDLEEKTNIYGQSTEGTPALRFSMLQPRMIDTLIAGGIGGDLPTPIGKYATKLGYPFGIKDYEEIFGKKFDEDAFKSIHFRLYLGEYEHLSPQLDVIRDCNYGIREDGLIGTGWKFAPKNISEAYKNAYNKNYRNKIFGVYERIANVLKQYEQSGLDIKFKFYKKDCHSPVAAEDLADAQFHDGKNFNENGSKLAFEVMKKIKQLEEFVKNNSENASVKAYIDFAKKGNLNSIPFARKVTEKLGNVEDEWQKSNTEKTTEITPHEIAELDKENAIATSEISFGKKIIEKIKSIFSKKDKDQR